MEGNNKPEEIVLSYAHPKAEEIVECYVQEKQLPGQRKKIKKRRKGLVIIACILVALLLGTALTFFFINKMYQSELSIGDENNESSASIVKINEDNEKPHIEKYKTEDDFRITLVNKGNKEDKLPEDIYAEVSEATVLVLNETQEGVVYGTGIILSEDGYLLTNAHVISGARSIWASFTDGTYYECQMVGYCFEEDIAILHCVDAKNLPCVEIGNSDECKIGQTVYAIGNPMGSKLTSTFTSGIISYTTRNIELDGTQMVMMQTDAAINSGNSGGPLINQYGQVIGITTLKYGSTTSGAITSATIENLGFAIPSSHFVSIVNEILETGEYKGVATLGITVALVTVESESGETLDVVMVVGLTEGLGGEEAGIMEGDIILKADDITINTTDDLLQVRDTHEIGDKMKLTVLRDSEMLDVNVKLYSNLKQ